MSSLRNEIKENIKSTLENSSIYAIPKILKSEYISLKIVFFFCLLFSVGWLGWFMSLTISDYLTWPVITSISINHVLQFTFPILTICNLNGFKTLNNTIVLCNFNQQRCTKDNDFEEAIDPYYGKCLRFNSGYSGTTSNRTEIPLKSIGKGTSLNNALEIHLTKGSDENTNRLNENGIVVFITNETIDSSIDAGIKLLPGTSTDIKLNKYTIIKQPKPYSSCLNGLTSVNSYKSEFYKKTLQKSKSGKYHYNDCRNLCYTKLIGDRCNFQIESFGPIFYENMKVYTPLDLAFLASSKNKTFSDLSQDIFKCLRKSGIEFSSSSNYIDACDCPIECQTSGFSYSTSLSQFPKESWAKSAYLKDNNSFLDFNLFYNNLKENLLFMRIYFEDATETVLSENPKYQAADLVSSLGGTISCLSLIELIEIFAKIGFIIYVSKRKNKTQAEVNSSVNLTEMQKMRLEIENLKKKIQPEVDYVDSNENNFRENTNSAEFAKMKLDIENLKSLLNKTINQNEHKIEIN